MGLGSRPLAEVVGFNAKGAEDSQRPQRIFQGYGDNDPNARSRIQSWLKNGSTVQFLELWEQHHNPDFNYMQMDVIKMRISENAYILTVKRWIEETNAIGIQAKAGRYGGTYAHRDIAFEFATWLSPVFKFYLIREFQRLKEEEASRDKLEWSYRRFLSKINYRLHTDAIKDHLLPKLVLAEQSN